MQIPNSDLQVKFYEITIALSGVMFPVFQAVLFFIVNKSFNKLEYTRQELISFYKKHGLIITTSLLYLIIQPLFQIIHFYKLSFWLFIVFSFTITLFRIQLFKMKGEWATYFSAKTNKFKNKFLQYLKYLWNNFFIEHIIFSFFLFSIFFPFLVGFSYIKQLSYNEDYIFISTLLVLIYVLISVAQLINTPTHIQDILMKNENTSLDAVNKNNEWSKDKIEREQDILLKQIKNNSSFSETEKEDKSGLFNYYFQSSIHKNGEFWNNIKLSIVEINDRDQLLKRIKEISKQYLIDLSLAKTDVNSFVLSFHFYLSNRKRNIFIRATKEEIGKIKGFPLDEFFKKLPHKIIDEVLR